MHEAYLRLVDVAQVQHWDSRGHFFSVAAEAMRRILIERARARGRKKRGENPERIDLTESMIVAPASDEHLLAVNDALLEFEKLDPEAAEIVKLRFFGGFTLQEIAESSEVSYRTVKRQWAYARAWLRAAVKAELELE